MSSRRDGGEEKRHCWSEYWFGVSFLAGHESTVPERLGLGLGLGLGKVSRHAGAHIGATSPQSDTVDTEEHAVLARA